MSELRKKGIERLLDPIWTRTWDGAKYQRILAKKVFPALNNSYGEGNWVWQQDGAPAHTCNDTLKFLREKLGSKRPWPKELWPPSSPNLNPLDYHVWTHVKTKACASPHPNVAAMKASMNKEWATMSTATISKLCGAFRSRLEKCIAAHGGIFEK